MKIAVVYWSGTGNTEAMAKCIEVGALGAGAEVDLFQCSSFTKDLVEDYDAFAFGCSACGSEELDEAEFVPMWDSVKDSLGDKKVVLFGSYGWGGGEWLETWKSNHGALNIVDEYACEEAPEGEAFTRCEELGRTLL